MICTKEGTPYLAGINHCACIWLCAPCSARIRRKRAAEIEAANALWVAAGHSITFVTLTSAHDEGDRLRLLLDAQAAAWKKITNGGAWTRLRKQLGIAGHITAIEITCGCNGWHPHRHVLLYTEDRIDAAGMVALDQHLRGRWGDVMEAAGLRRPDQDHGLDIRYNCADHGLGQYVAKVQEGDWGVAQEMTRGDLKDGRKSHRTPFEVLAAYFTGGDVADRDLWLEYTRATRGLSAVKWSRGLRAAIFGPGAVERSDAELAAEEDAGGQMIAQVPGTVWARVTMAGLELDVVYAALGGLQAVNELLAETGCGWANAPPDRPG